MDTDYCKTCGQSLTGKISPAVKREVVKLLTTTNLGIREIARRFDGKISFASVSRICRDITKGKIIPLGKRRKS